MHLPHDLRDPYPGKRRRSVRFGAVIAGAALICAAVAGIGGGVGAADAPFYANTFEKVPSAAAMTDIGRALFFDASLSASGRLACATCHDPRRAFGPPDDSPVQRGGRDWRRPGVRAVPSLTVRRNVATVSEHS